mgnify:CR=1 FL=1
MSHNLHHFGDAQTLAKAAAERWRAALLERNPSRPFTVALSGGRIPKALYKALGMRPPDNATVKGRLGFRSSNAARHRSAAALASV